MQSATRGSTKRDEAAKLKGGSKTKEQMKATKKKKKEHTVAILSRRGCGV
jgi:hypothetical protein